MKTQLNDLQDENTNLQMQIQKLNAKLQKVMPVTKHENVDACMVPNPLDDILKILEKRTTTQLADDGVSFSLLFFFEYLTLGLWYINLF